MFRFIIAQAQEAVGAIEAKLKEGGGEGANLGWYRPFRKPELAGHLFFLSR